MNYFIAGYLTILFLLPNIAQAHPGFLDANHGHSCTVNCEKFGVAKGAYHKHTFSLGAPSGSSSGSSGSSHNQGATSMMNNRKRHDPNYQSGIVMDIIENTEQKHSAIDNAVVTEIINGNTIKALLKEEEIELSLYGIKAPKLGQEFGSDTAQALKNTILGKRIILQGIDFTESNKARAVVIMNDMNINQEMVKLGYAWVYVKKCRKEFCDNWIADQVKARKKDRGLWQSTNPISPWEWEDAQETEETQVQ